MKYIFHICYSCKDGDGCLDIRYTYKELDHKRLTIQDYEYFRNSISRNRSVVIISTTLLHKSKTDV